MRVATIAKHLKSTTLHLASILLCCAAASPGVAAAQVTNTHCQTVTLLLPAAGSTISESKPTLQWTSSPEAQRYRVRLRSDRPNGALLAAIDTITTEPRFTPPTSLTDEIATVRADITPDCSPAFGDPLPAAFANSPRFWIDTRLSCSPPTLVSVQSGKEASPTMLRWTASSSAQRYEASILLADGTLLVTDETQQTFLPLSQSTAQRIRTASPAHTAVASVRARCANGWSAPAQAIVDQRFGAQPAIESNAKP